MLSKRRSLLKRCLAMAPLHRTRLPGRSSRGSDGPSRPSSTPLAFGLATAATAYYAGFRPAGPSAPAASVTIAVLPFQNLSTTPERSTSGTGSLRRPLRRSAVRFLTNPCDRPDVEHGFTEVRISARGPYVGFTSFRQTTTGSAATLPLSGVVHRDAAWRIGYVKNRARRMRGCQAVISMRGPSVARL